MIAELAAGEKVLITTEAIKLELFICWRKDLDTADDENLVSKNCNNEVINALMFSSGIS